MGCVVIDGSVRGVSGDGGRRTACRYVRLVHVRRKPPQPVVQQSLKTLSELRVEHRSYGTLAGQLAVGAGARHGTDVHGGILSLQSCLKDCAEVLRETGGRS